jgi:hypothetical protein
MVTELELIVVFMWEKDRRSNISQIDRLDEYNVTSLSV